MRRVPRSAEDWERLLCAEGLAPIEQHLCGRVVIRTEIIAPQRQYLTDPARLVRALEAWLAGDRSGFDDHGLGLLERTMGRHGKGNPQWPQRRARALVLVCEALAEGTTMIEASRRAGIDRDIAYSYLRPLSASILSADPALVDDDSGDDGTSGD